MIDHSDIDRIFDCLIASDVMVTKTLGVSRAASVSLNENRMSDYLLAQWNLLVKEAAERAASVLTSGSGDTVMAGDVDRALSEAGKVMAKWSGRVVANYKRYIESVYRYGREVGLRQTLGAKPNSMGVFEFEVTKASKKIDVAMAIKPSFDLQDIESINSLKESQVFWIGDHYEKNVSQPISVFSTVQIGAGMSRVDAGKMIHDHFLIEANKVELPSGWKGSSRGYFTMLVGNATTVARANGHLNSFAKAGFTTYVVRNPEDSRTCEVCRYLDGKEFRVSDGMALNKVLNSFKSPAGVKEMKPWLNPAKALKLAGSAGPAGWKKTTKLHNEGYSVPPFHGFCRCDLDVSGKTVLFEEPDIGDGAEVKSQIVGPGFIDAVQTKMAKPIQPPKVEPIKPPPPIPKAGEAPVKATADSSEALKPNSFPWDITKLEQFDQHFGGGHGGKLGFIDPDGNKWMFKPNNPIMSYGEDCACKLGNALGVPQAEVYVVRIGNKLGTIQKLYQGVAADLKAGGGVPIESLTGTQLGQVQREHAYDWLIGNHDGHGGNLLKVGDNIKGIDKGQAYKFLNLDKLSIDYNPNLEIGEISYVNQQLKRYVSGEIKSSFTIGRSMELEKFLDDVMAMPDEDFVNIIRPYFSRGVGTGMGSFAQYDTEAKFIEAALIRKHNLRESLKMFWEDIEKKRAQVTGKPLPKTPKPKAPKAPKPKIPKGEITPIDNEFVQSVKDAKWAGKVLHIAGDDFEDMQALVYATNRSMFITGKLRRAANERILALSQRVIGATNPDDPYWKKVIRYVKHINFHLGPGGDGQIAQEVKDLTPFLQEILTANINEVAPSVRSTVVYYQKELAKVMNKDGTVRMAGIGQKIEQYVPQAEKVPGIKGIKVVNSYGQNERKLEAGVINEISGDLQHEWHGEQFKIEFDSGVKATYVRHDDGNLYSKQGRITFELGNGIQHVTPDDIKQALDSLEALSIPAKLAKSEDLEYVYLVKVANAANLHNDPRFMPEVGKTISENIQRMKSAWTEKLGVSDLKKVGYNPIPIAEYEDGTGLAHWERFDLDIKQLEKEGVGVYHELYRGISDLEIIANSKTGGLIATENKLRAGIIPKGKSPDDDQRHGSASYVFTRLSTPKKASSNGSHLRFNTGILKDPDAISYTHDCYGDVHPDFMTVERKFGYESVKDIGLNGRTDNETMFKGAISFTKWLEEIRVNDEGEKEQVVKWFKENGLDRVGVKKRPIEDIISIGKFTGK